MKIVKLSTTTKLYLLRSKQASFAYLLTLLVIFGLIFLNQSIFAQEQTKSTASQKRIKIMERYLSWIETNEYGEYKNQLGKKALGDFKSFLTKALPEDKDCLNSKSTPKPTFVQNIESFFSTIIPQSSQSSPNQTPLSSCKGKIKDDYKLAKKYNRALKYLQIEEGKPNVCIKADLGVGTALMARGFNPTKVDSDNPKETGLSEKLRVYLCTGNDGKKKVRAVDDSGTRLRLAPADAAKPEFKVENLPPKGSFEILIGKLGL